MPGIFDSKIFNAEVFQGYVDRLPNPNMNALIKSKAIRQRPDLAATMRDQAGGNYMYSTMSGLISGTAPLNYDGKTDITASNTKTFGQGRVVVGRAAAWTENDFSYDMTNKDFMEEIAAQVGDYWVDVDQNTLVNILTGIFSMTTGAANQEFVAKHTYDVTEKTNSEGTTGHMDGTTLNTAIQRACGDNKGKFALACMHSAVATNLENLKILTYLKQNDANGMEREVGLATLNGKLVLIDDNMPTSDAGGGAVEYTTFVLGEGAIEYTNCGAKVPFESLRDPKTKGGQDMLFSRQRKCFAPYGISFTKKHMASLSPEDDELRNGGNWELVNSIGRESSGEGDPGEAAVYINHKMIPIARIISLG